jgi:D-3-phosphoglycerate dehydrogenase
VQTAEQVVAALTGGVVSTAVNIPAISPEDMDVLGPFLPLVDRLARLAMALAEGSGVDRIEVEYFGRIAERDTRLLTLAALQGVLTGHCEEEVNLVNAPSLADERGIGVSERSETAARDFTDLVRIAIVSGRERYRVVGTTLGRQNRPHLLEAWGQRFNLQLDEGVHMALFRYCDLPGMMGRVGTLLGERGVNISSAAVGRQPPGEDGRRNEVAVMVVTTDSPVPRDVVVQIARSDGFLAGRAVSL